MSGQPNIDGTRRVLILMQEIETLEKECNALEVAAQKLPDARNEHARKFDALKKELEAMNVERPGNFGYYTRLAQFVNQIRVEMNASLIRDTTKEEPPAETGVLVWDNCYWRIASYRQSPSAQKGEGRLPNANHWATWLVESIEGPRQYRWFIDIAAIKPPEGL